MKKTLLLFLLIAFAAILNFLPHINYPYPLHVDEWVHYQYANKITNGVGYFDYFNGNKISLEHGFHILLAVLNSLMPSLFMFKFLPIIITIILSLGIFITARRIFNENAALFSVLFLGLLQSNTAILGPLFLVPMASGLFLITIGLFMLEIKSNLFFLPLAALLIIHPPSALAYFMIININLVIKRKKILNKITFQLLAFLIALPLYIPTFIQKGLNTLDSLNFTIISNALFIPKFLGYLTTALIALGIYFAIHNKKRYDIIAYVFSFLFFIFLFYKLELEFFLPYRRTLMFLFLIFAFLFGYGCSQLIDRPNKKITILITLSLLSLILIFNLPPKIESAKEVYHIINDQDYNTLIKIANLSYGIILTDPWISNAISPIANKPVYSRIVQGPNAFFEDRNKKINEFFRNKCNDTEFLKSNNISIIYYSECDSPYLTEIFNNTYAYKLNVTRVSDGDTFEIESGQKIRMICVDSPEKDQPGYLDAKEFLRNLIENKTIILEKDISDKDQYGRLLRYVYHDNFFVNKELVKSGNAEVFRYGNDTKRCDEISS